MTWSIQVPVLFFAILALLPVASSTVDIFVHGDLGFPCWRVPAVALAKSTGVLFAFAEARNYSTIRPPCILAKCAASCNPHSIHCVMQLPVSVSSAPTFSVKTFLSSSKHSHLLFVILFSNRRRWLYNCRDETTERRPTKPWAQDVRQPRLQAKINFASACCHF